jgi:hypothetical protein
MQSTLQPRERQWPRSKASGFSIIELTIVCALLAIMAAVAAPQWNRANERIALTSCQRMFEADMGALRRFCSRQSRMHSVAFTEGTGVVTVTPPVPELLGNASGVIDYTLYCPGVSFTGMDFDSGSSFQINIFGELLVPSSTSRLQSASVTLNLQSSNRVTDLLQLGAGPSASSTAGAPP